MSNDRSLLEWAFENSPVATLFIASDGTILRWNQKAAEYCFPTRLEDRPVFFQDLFAVRDDQDLLSLISDQRDEPVQREALLKAARGEERCCEVLLFSRSKKSGEPTVRLCFIRDLGEIQTNRTKTADSQGESITEAEERHRVEAALRQTWSGCRKRFTNTGAETGIPPFFGK